MSGLTLVSYFFAGVFATNAVPHSVAGLMGRAFQSPFAKPPGKGLSSPTVNVVWGFVNIAAAYLLLTRVGNFHPHASEHALAFGLGVLLISLHLARYFGRLHEGSAPPRL